MWCSDRRRFLVTLAGAAMLPSCGFQPLYAEDGPSQGLRRRMVVGKITHGPFPNRLTFRMAEALKRGIGTTERPEFRLDASVVLDETGLAITPDNATTRYNLAGRADWTLIPLGTAEPVLSGVAESYTAYSATASVYATRIAQRDAELRLARSLAERILIEIAARSVEVPA